MLEKQIQKMHKDLKFRQLHKEMKQEALVGTGINKKDTRRKATRWFPTVSKRRPQESA